ncbi:MAG: molybdopterin-dependent oxidoreductase [Candidatus Zixiibacteriota bacterium]
MKRILLEICLVLFISLWGGTCANKMEGDVARKTGLKELREYQGQELSSSSDFSENSIKGPQRIDQGSYRLRITGLVTAPKTYSYDEVIRHSNYQKIVPLDCVEGWSVNILWEGVLVKDLINQAGVDPRAKIVIFHSYDGYSTSFPLNYIMDRNIIMAYKMNGLPLPPERGFPFELVAEGKWGYKWAKWITEIELSDNEAYRGYWESRGYSNDGDLGKSYLEER